MSKYAVQKAIYNGLALPATYGVFSAARVFHSKLRATFRERRHLRSRWLEAAARLSGRPVWFHVSSVGEYEQAKPMISALKEHYPDVPVALTFTSPSGYHYASAKEQLDETNNIQFMDYLPVDFTDNARFCLNTLDPRLLVFVKFDLWPNLIWEASSRGIPTMLMDATLSESSYRFSAVGRRFYRAVYSHLREILAISERDAERFSACVPGHPRIIVTGDTRFDRVVERRRMKSASLLQVEHGERFVVVSGSTWPQDEVHLLGAVADLLRQERRALLIIAPHEPTTARVADLLHWAKSQRLSAVTLSQRNRIQDHNGNGQIIVVDSVGVLAETYELGDAAYIGGSFSSGVHSVIEPAIMGIPVLFGPVHKNSFEAMELLNRDAAFEVTDRRDIFERLSAMLKNEAVRRSMGGRAKDYVESQLGATNRCMARFAEYLS